MFDHPVPSTCWPYTSAACVMMGRPLRRFTLAPVWVLAFVSPAIAEDGLIYFLTPASVQLFDTASEKDEFWPLIARFVSERRETFCGVASSVMVLNALGITPPPTPEWYPNQYWTQENIFHGRRAQGGPPAGGDRGRRIDARSSRDTAQDVGCEGGDGVRSGHQCRSIQIGRDRGHAPG
jgi:hypothetical protein